MTSSRIEFADCMLDLVSFELQRAGKRQNIEPQVFDLIRFFAENSGQLLTRDDLIDGVWGGRIVSDAAISTRISMARKALGDNGKSQKYIQTVPRRGFRFTPESRVVGQPTPAPALELPKRPSIVVMPIQCLTENVETRYAAQGLRIDIQNALIKVSGLFLIAAGSASAVGDLAARDAAASLGVRYVLTGQIRRSETAIRYSAQLEDTVDSRILWSENYDRDLGEAAAFLDDVVADVLAAINVQLVAGEDARVWHKTLTDLKSLEIFYRGVDSFFHMTAESLASAKSDFERIARKHPAMAIGPTWVALTHWYEFQRGWAPDAEASRRAARHWAEKGVACADHDGQAHTVLSHIYLLEREFEKALDAGREAVGTRPNCTHANAFYANVLHFCGANREALFRIDAAIRFAPMHPALFELIRASALRGCGNRSEATEAAESVVATNPENTAALFLLAILAAEAKDADRAAGFVARLRMNADGFEMGDFLARQPYQDHQTMTLLRRAAEWACQQERGA